MTATTSALTLVPDDRAALARLEARRFARHPLFLAGLVVCVALTALTAAADYATANALGAGFTPAFTIGLFSMLTAYRLTRSTRPADEAIDATPAARTQRTAALLAACAVPALAAAVWLAIAVPLLEARAPGWAFGPFGFGERLAILAGHSIVAAAGASLLGVAAGRWLRFPAAGLVLLVAVTGWVIVGFSATMSSPDATAPNLLRLASPLAFFHDAVSSEVVEFWTGAPAWHLVWLVGLCVLAGAAALLRDVEGPQRQRVLRAAAGAAIVAVVGLTLAATSGLSHPVRDAAPGVSTEVDRG